MKSEFDKTISPTDFNFNQFNTFLTNWSPNIADTMKYDLFIPLCSTSMTQGWKTDGYNNLMNSAFDTLSVKEYSEELIYNKKIMEPDEKMSEIPVSVNE